MFYPYEGYRSVTPLDAARVNRPIKNKIFARARTRWNLCFHAGAADLFLPDAKRRIFNVDRPDKGGGGIWHRPISPKRRTSFHIQQNKGDGRKPLSLPPVTSNWW